MAEIRVVQSQRPDGMTDCTILLDGSSAKLFYMLLSVFNTVSKRIGLPPPGLAQLLELGSEPEENARRDCVRINLSEAMKQAEGGDEP